MLRECRESPGDRRCREAKVAITLRRDEQRRGPVQQSAIGRPECNHPNQEAQQRKIVIRLGLYWYQ